DRLIDLDRRVRAGQRSNSAQGSTAQVRSLPADDAPVPAMSAIEIEHLGGGILGAEITAETRIELHRGNKGVVAEHVAELERNPAADRSAKSTGADRDGRLGDLL